MSDEKGGVDLMGRLIDADALQAELLRMEFFPAMVKAAIRRTPTVDAVPAAAYEQVRWERDMAMKQLKEHGIPFGGVAPDVVEVVRCKDCKYWQDNNDGYPHEECRWGNGETPGANDFCSYGERKEGDD